MTIAEMTKAVSTYMYYMWNTWDKREAYLIYGKVMGDHFYGKWEGYYEMMQSPSGAAEQLWANMTDGNREKLMKRASELYDGMCNRK